MTQATKSIRMKIHVDQHLVSRRNHHDFVLIARDEMKIFSSAVFRLTRKKFAQYAAPLQGGILLSWLYRSTECHGFDNIRYRNRQVGHHRILTRNSHKRRLSYRYASLLSPILTSQTKINAYVKEPLNIQVAISAWEPCDAQTELIVFEPIATDKMSPSNVSVLRT